MHTRLPSLLQRQYRCFYYKSRSFQRRSVVTQLIEPPLDSSIPERPCTVALLQDGENNICHDRWEDILSKWLPEDQGTTFAHLDLGNLLLSDLGASLHALQADLQDLMSPQVVLVARGPMVSWLALLHLESHSLAGLVLVDPLPLDDKTVMKSLEDLDDGAHLQSISNFYSKRPLLLEPGAVPMMILKSRDEKLFAEGAELTANRHKRIREDDTEFVSGDVPVVSLAQGQDDTLETNFRELIIPWIESQVL